MKTILRLALQVFVAVAIPACGDGESSLSSDAFGPAAGVLDPSFNLTGYVIAPIGDSNDRGRAAAVQPDGKIVVVGYAQMASNDFMVSRYNADGTLDATFGAGGIVTEDVAGSMDVANAVVMQADGKIVVVGYADTGSTFDFALVRYNGDGTLDETFGTGGLTITDLGSWECASAAVPDGEGRIVVAGADSSVGDWIVARYTADGALDETFGGDGIVTTALGTGYDWAYGVAVDPDGRIVVAGDYENAANWDFAVARYRPDGLLDTTFGEGAGFVTTDVAGADDSAQGVGVLADGKIVAVGYSYDGADSDFTAVRYALDGTPDATFGSGGIATTVIEASDESAYAVALQPDGKIVAVGEAGDDAAGWRVNLDGSADVTFGDGGIVQSDLGGSECAYAVAIQLDGRIAIVGVSFLPGFDMDVLICRYR